MSACSTRGGRWTVLRYALALMLGPLPRLADYPRSCAAAGDDRRPGRRPRAGRRRHHRPPAGAIEIAPQPLRLIVAAGPFVLRALIAPRRRFHSATPRRQNRIGGRFGEVAAMTGSYDLAIVGGGFAGLVCARSAALGACARWCWNGSRRPATVFTPPASWSRRWRSAGKCRRG